MAILLILKGWSLAMVRGSSLVAVARGHPSTRSGNICELILRAIIESMISGNHPTGKIAYLSKVVTEREISAGWSGMSSGAPSPWPL